MLEYCANRKPKAFGVPRFATAGVDDGGGREGVPWTEPGDQH